jgi:hypothetical protein
MAWVGCIDLEDAARAVQEDYCTAELKPREVVLLDYAIKLRRERKFGTGRAPVREGVK